MPPRHSQLCRTVLCVLLIQKSLLPRTEVWSETIRIRSLLSRLYLSRAFHLTCHQAALRYRLKDMYPSTLNHGRVLLQTIRQKPYETFMVRDLVLQLGRFNMPKARCVDRCQCSIKLTFRNPFHSDRSISGQHQRRAAIYLLGVLNTTVRADR